MSQRAVTPPMRPSNALLCWLVALAGCAASPLKGALREPAAPSLTQRAVAAPPVSAAAAAPSATGVMAPTPFTAEQIRDATQNGRRYMWLSPISLQRRIMTKSRWTDPAPSSSCAPAATTSIAQDLLEEIVTSSS